MDKETQDLAWQSLPKEVREEIKRHYQSYSCNIYTQALFEDVFGNNLTSDTEPEEMLSCTLKDIRERWKLNEDILTSDPTNNIALGIKSVLLGLFGDKCLPDKKPEQPSAQAEPKDKVDSLDANVATLDINVAILNATDETKDNMEEKDFHLCDILSGCEGERIFLPGEGECEIVSIRKNAIEFTRNGIDRFGLYNESLRLGSTGFAYAYPSEESFLANPLNARKVWQEWLEARKPKHYLKVYIEGFQDGTLSMPDVRITEWLKFRTIDEVKQAAEGIREYLMNFHKQHTEQ